MFTEYMQKQKVSAYRLSKNTGIPYTTLTDILSGKADIAKCSAETVYKLAREFGVTMETLLEQRLDGRLSFELFKSNVCHSLKKLGDTGFIISTLESDDIRRYYNRKWYPECFYLLAMLDYISRINGVPLCDDYSDLRCGTLSEKLYPSGVTAMSAVSGSNEAKLLAEKESIPEFRRFNIIEGDVRNVV